MRIGLTEWQSRLTGGTAHVRQTLREILIGPLVVRQDRFEGELLLGSLLAGEIGLATYVARPAGLAHARDEWSETRRELETVGRSQLAL